MSGCRWRHHGRRHVSGFRHRSHGIQSGSAGVEESRGGWRSISRDQVVLSFLVGAVIAVSFGYTDPVSVSTIGAGAATYIVGSVTGTALGADSGVIGLSVAAGLIKSVLVMIGTPFVAPRIGLDNAQAAMIYVGLMGTTSGVAGGLAATDPKLVPYGAMTATFYTGVGCLLVPSVLFHIVRAAL